MKSSKTYELSAILSTLSGVLLLGFLCYPLLNPVQYSLTPGLQIAPWQRYVLGPVITILLLAAGCYCNVKARQINGTDKPQA